MIPLILAAQLVATPPAKAATFFSPAALNDPVLGCGRGPKQPVISGFEAGWFTAVWSRADEPSLALTAAASTRPTWRFTDIPTWTAPTTYRLTEQDDGRLRMVAKRLSGKGGYDPGTLKDHVDRVLTPDEEARFRAGLRSVDDVLADPGDNCMVVLDGTVLLFERTQAGRYAVGKRFWEVGHPMAAMDALLAGFAGWDRRRDAGGG